MVMMCRPLAALAAMFVLATALEAQARSRPAAADPPAAVEPEPSPPRHADKFAAAVPEPPAAPVARMVGAVQVGNAEIGVGRFNVGEIARPRTHTETDRDPLGFNRRGRSIAGMGFSFRF